MGHWCHVCGENKSNESFSGKGHRNHICKACKALPKQERDATVHAMEIHDFLAQKNISPKNIARLRVLAAATHAKTATLAQLVLEMALVKPHRRKRLKFLIENHRELLKRLVAADLIFFNVDDLEYNGLEWDDVALFLDDEPQGDQMPF